jgi:hypothetical protein
MQHRIVGDKLRVERAGDIPAMRSQSGVPRNEMRYDFGDRHLAAFIKFDLFGMPSANFPQYAVVLDSHFQRPMWRLHHDISPDDPALPF